MFLLFLEVCYRFNVNNTLKYPRFVAVQLAAIFVTVPKLGECNNCRMIRKFVSVNF